MYWVCLITVTMRERETWYFTSGHDKFLGRHMFICKVSSSIIGKRWVWKGGVICTISKDAADRHCLPTNKQKPRWLNEFDEAIEVQEVCINALGVVEGLVLQLQHQSPSSRNIKPRHQRCFVRLIIRTPRHNHILRLACHSMISLLAKVPSLHCPPLLWSAPVGARRLRG